MVAEKRYLYDLSLPEKKVSKKPQDKFRLIKNTNKNTITNKNKATLVLTTLAIFTMFMVITYRYNVISEKNLHVQELKEDLVVAKSELATTQIAMEEIMNEAEVESYAKQQLGMQKPEKSQLIYVNMESKESVQRISANNVITSLIQKVKGFVNDVF